MDSKSFRIKIHTAYHAVCHPSWSWDSSVHSFERFNLWFVLKGKGTMNSGGISYPLAAGDCFLLRTWDRQMAHHDPNNPLTVPFVIFDIVNDRGLPIPRQHLDLPPVHRRIHSPVFFNEIMQKIIGLRMRGKLDTVEAGRWLDVALIEYGNQPDDALSEAEGVRRQKECIDQWCLRIGSEERFDVSVDDMARESCYSIDHFIRLFKKHTGATPAEYVINSRIERAETLLTTSSHSIGEIAEMVGYPDIHTFSRQFRDRTGKPPSQFRRGRG